jgi:hypothetical protein
MNFSGSKASHFFPHGVDNNQFMVILPDIDNRSYLTQVFGTKNNPPPEPKMKGVLK